MSTRLCAVCNGIFTGLLVDRRLMPHHQSVASLRRSAEEGCYICNLVSAMLEFDKVSDDDGPFQWMLYTNSEEGLHNPQQYKTYGRLSIEAKNGNYVLEFMDVASPNAPIRSVDPGASLTDQAVIETARSWLENCRQNHASCEPADPAFNPTRLLYIHDVSSVQLIETEKETKTHAYVAFSHCWGKSKTLKLLQDDGKEKGNIKELCSLIQVQRLPTSYREAIAVSLALGFRHIWIDSLCIIQNSYDDWAKEAAMMKDVYANSSLNLCASAAAESSEASFQHRGRGFIVPLDIEPHWTGILHDDDEERKVGMSKLEPLPSYLHRIKFKLVHEGMHRSEISESPLNSRAWVMQERVLSRRHLFMTCHQLWWECRDLYANEVYPAGVPDSSQEYFEADRARYYMLSTSGQHSSHHGSVLDGSPVGQPDSSLGEPARHSPFRELSEYDNMDLLWDSIVEQYSLCDLTYSSDKLPALSGLAQNFSIARGPGFSLNLNSYLAGIWRPHLPNALSWVSSSDEDSGRVRRYRPDLYRAPSWSWTSVEGSVNAWPLREEELVCCVVDAKVLYDDERYKASTVKGGILHLRSRLVGPFMYRKSSDPDLTPCPSLDSRVREAIDTPHNQWSADWDECDGDSGKCFITYLDPLPHTMHQDGIVKGTDAVRKRVWLDDLADEPCIRLFLAPLLLDSAWGILGGLILCQVVNDIELEGVDEGVVFQRVGYFQNQGIEKEVLDLVPERTIAII
ncbi:HET-domain-containing protein [Neurospora crassa]|nr:HET-domain-containing protein [Neurospora crassa]